MNGKRWKMILCLILLEVGALGCVHGPPRNRIVWAQWPDGLPVERQAMGDVVDAEFNKCGESCPLEVRVMHKALTAFRERFHFTPGENESCPGYPSVIEVFFARQGGRYFVTVGAGVMECGPLILLHESPTWEFDANGRQVAP